METEKIRVDRYSLARLKQNIEQGILRIPRFQRRFVWERTRIQKLLDSMCKEYPIGTFFFWEAPSEYNHLLRNVEDLRQPILKEGGDYTFILDGQQRVISLYAVIKGLTIEGEDYSKIVVDLGNQDYAKLSFQYRTPDNRRWVAVRDLLDESDHLSIYDDLSPEYRYRFQRFRNLLVNYPFSVVIVSDMDMEDAIEIFERINQQGKRLSRYDLIAANVLTDDFDFREKTKLDIILPLEKTFGKIAETSVPQALALNIKDRTEHTTQMRLETEEIQTHWEETVECFKLAVDFARRNLGVARVDFLPYDAMLPVLAYYFFRGQTHTVLSSHHREQLERWFWRVAFSERYSGASQTRMTEDAAWIRSLIGDNKPYEHPVNIDIDTLLASSMRNTTSAIRNGVLCLLNLQRPRHFISGAEIEITGSYFSKFTLAERHHIFPIGFLKEIGYTDSRVVHQIPNFCFIPAELNRKISNNPPSQYMSDILRHHADEYEFEKIMRTHLIPVGEDSGLWDDDYPRFLRQRAALLLDEIKVRCGMSSRLDEQERNPVMDAVERALRDTIHEVLCAAYGHDYWREGISSVAGDVHKNIEIRVEQHVRETPGISKRQFDEPRPRLDFLDVSDYAKIITRKKNWRHFASVFRDQRDCDRYLNDFREFRNAVKHNRAIDSILDHRGQAAVVWLSRTMNLDLSQC